MLKLSNLQSLKFLIVFILRIFDIPSLIFREYHSTTILILQDFGFNYFNITIFNILCSFCDLLFALKTNSFNYYFFNSFFPNNIASIENFIILFKIRDLYPLLCFYDPFCLLKLPNPLLNFTDLLILINHSRSLGILDTLVEIYSRGYKFSHLPCLNGPWYLMVCMVEQYSKLCYTLNIIYGNFISNRDIRTLIIFKNGSGFTNYLPFIVESKNINLYVVIGLIFEYVFMNFKINETVNTNFLYWFGLIFIGLYIYDIKVNKFNIK